MTIVPKEELTKDTVISIIKYMVADRLKRKYEGLDSEFKVESFSIDTMIINISGCATLKDDCYSRRNKPFRFTFTESAFK